MADPRRICVIPDGQNKPGAPQDHWPWVAQYIVDTKPDAVVNIGDWWDFPSLSRWEKKGGVALEGARYQDDLHAGNFAFGLIDDPIQAERARLKRNKEKQWNPELHFLLGNHDIRPDRVANDDATLIGTIGSQDLDTRGWQVHGFLKRVFIDDILFCHYLQNANNPRPIGGGIENRLTKVGRSFVVGHVQGLSVGTKQLGDGRTIRGVECGSCYLHREEYRGAQGQEHFRGLIMLNEVRGDGRFSFMDVTLDYLCRRYEGVSLLEYMSKKYSHGDWTFLA